VAVFAIVTYAWTYTVLSYHTDPTQSAWEPLRLAMYVLQVVGSVFPFQPRIPAAVMAAMVAGPAIILSLVLMLRFYLTPFIRPATLFGTAVAGHATMLIIASLGMALMTALGRLTINNGLESRYSVIAFIFWCALLILLLMSVRRYVVPTVVLIAALLALAVGYLPARDYHLSLRSRQQDMYRAGVMATAGLHYGLQFPTLFPALQPLDEVWHQARPPFQSFAKREPFGLIDTILADLPLTPASSRCFGFVETVTPLKDAPRVVSISGWAFIASFDSSLRWVVVTDTSNRGLGVGKTGLLRADVRAVFAGQGINENPKDKNNSAY